MSVCHFHAVKPFALECFLILFSNLTDHNFFVFKQCIQREKSQLGHENFTQRNYRLGEMVLVGLILK